MMVCILDDVPILTSESSREWSVAADPSLYASDGVNTAGEWFAQRLAPKLREEWQATRLFLIHVNFKFSSQARRLERTGLAIFQHIRLTASLPENVRKAHVVLYSVESEASLRGRDLANLVMYSPGVTIVRLPEGLEQLKDPQQWSLWASEPANLDDPSLRQLFRLGLEHKIGPLYEHHYRNRAGAAKFLIEFAGDVISQENPILNELKRAEQEDLTWKRMRFVMPQLAPAEQPARRELESFRELAGKHRYLLIDDEYDQGWRLGLEAGLRGSEQSDGAVEVLRGIEQAMAFINRCKETKEKSLQEWRNAWREVVQATARLDQAERRKANATSVSAKAKTSYQQTESQFRLLNQRGQQMWPKRLSITKQALADAEQAFRNAESECEVARSACKDAITRYNEAQEALFKAFPYELVFLDLRLRDEDTTCSLGEVSGWKVLQELKEHFPQVPVIIFTASAKALSVELARKWGADGYWVKGVSSGQELRELVGRLLRRTARPELWNKLLLVRSMPRVRRRFYDAGRNCVLAEWLDQGHSDRTYAESLLEDTFWLFWDESDDRPQTGRRRPAAEAAIRNLSLVQEIRFRGFSTYAWWSAPEKEREYRQLRTEVVHASKQPQATIAKALEYFRYTLDDLLQAPTLTLGEFCGVP